MTIASSTNRVSFNCNGVTVAFAVSFPFQLQADLVILSTVITTGISTTQALITDYTISGTVDSLGFYSSGGTVTFLVAPANTVRITIYRDPARTQGLDLVENDSLPAESVEAQLDYLTMLVQRLFDITGRTLHQPDGDASSVGIMPSSVDRASHYLSFDANGDPIASASVDAASVSVSSFIETLLDDANAATARTTLGVAAATSGIYTTCTAAADPLVALGLSTKKYVDTRTGTTASYTGTANLALGVRLARLSGASFTLTVPDATLHTDRIFTASHSGASLTQVYTLQSVSNFVAPDGTATTYLLYTAGERVSWISDGTQWVQLEHQARTEWVDAGVMTITATSVNPTKPTTPDIDKVYWRRDGNRLYLRYILQISSAAGSAAGTGNYLLALPTNITFDTTVLTPVGTTLATAIRSEASASFLDGSGYASADSTSAALASFFAYDTSRFQVQLIEVTDGSVATPGGLGSSNHAVTNGESAYNFMPNARAANWRL